MKEPAAGSPGPLSRILGELAAAPGDGLLEAWQEELRPGDRLDRFEIRREVGRGGFGAVFEAWDGELGRAVAIKTLRPGRTRKELSAGWIRREAEAVARLGHPGIVTIHDVCNCSAGPYLVMELLRGRTLAQRLEEGTLPALEAERIAAEMGMALAHAHGRGVLHRDLKPANVFLCDDGGVKLLDFGLAHLLGTPQDGGGGTPAYMAPEQARGDAIDERADVFAAGRVLEEMLGEHPSRRLSEAVAAATAPDREARPRDGKAWLDLLQHNRRAAERGARTRKLAWMAAGLLALAAGIAGVATWQERRAHDLVDAAGRITVAVADFQNATRDPDLDGLSGLLVTSLEQSRKLRVLTRGRLIELIRQMGLDRGQRIDEALAREVGKKAGVRVLLLASVQKLGETYVAELRAIDPERDAYLFTLQEKAIGKEGLLPLIDRLSDRARVELREGQADVKASEVNVAEAVTPSLEAYRHYFRGLERSARLDDDGALAEFKAALAMEPRFALAELEIAQLDTLYGRDGDPAFQRASAHAETLPVKERELVRAEIALHAGRRADAVAILEPLALRFPDDRFVARAAGGAAGCPEGMAHRRRALALAPDWDRARLDLLNCLLWQGKSEEAIAEAEGAEQARPTSSSATAVALARYESGDVDGAIAAARRAGERGHTNWSRGILISALATRGAFDEAATEARGLSGEMKNMQCVVHAEMGQLGACLTIGDDIVRANGTWPGGLRNRRAAIAVARGRAPPGDSPSAIALDGWWGPFTVMLIRDPDELAAAAQATGNETAIGQMYRALLAGERGDVAGALAQLPVEGRVLGDLQLYYRGIYASELGRDAEAIAAFAQLEKRNISYFANVYRAFLLARGRYLTALSLERMGRRDEARAVLAKQLDRWKDADPDLPLLAEMKTLCRKVACQPGASP